MMRGLLMAATGSFAICACAQSGSAAGVPLRSGFYEGFVLAVSPSGRVSGHFDMTQGEGVTKRCQFDFVGQASGGGATIRTVGAPALSGHLTATSADEVRFSMARVRSLPGCGLVLPPEAEAAGTELDRIRIGNWSGLAHVTGGRVAFRTTPGGAPGRAYLVKGDVVGVVGRQGDQVQVVYPSERNSWSQGWVPAGDLAAL